MIFRRTIVLPTIVAVFLHPVNISYAAVLFLLHMSLPPRNIARQWFNPTQKD